jgi:DNA-binding protein HU-beta
MAAGMTKTQLVRHLAEKTGTNNKTAAAFLLTLTDTAIKEAKKNGLFVLPGLGRLKKSQRKARMGRNPQIAAKTVAKFYLAKAVKDSIAPGKK